MKCNGERVPPTVLMSSGRVNCFQGKTAGWSVSSHSHSILSVSVTPLGDVNLGLARPQPGHGMISGRVKKLDWAHLRVRECAECAAFPPDAEYRKITNDLTKPLGELKKRKKKTLPCILHCV